MQNYNYQQMPPAHYAPYQPYPPYSPYPPAPQFTPEQLERRELRKTSNGLGFFVLAFFLIMQVSAILISHMLSTAQIVTEENQTSLIFVLQIIVSIASAMTAVLFYRILSRKRLSSHLTRSHVKPSLLIPMLFAGKGAAMLANVLAGLFDQNISIFHLENTVSQTTPTKSVPEIILYVVSTAVIPALSEELAFRGVFMNIMRKYGDAFAIVTSAVMFGAMHGNTTQIVFAFLLGLIFAYMDCKVNSIIPSVLVHFANNFYAVVTDIAGSNLGLDDNTVTAIRVGIIAMFAVLGILSYIYLINRQPEFFKLNGKEGEFAATGSLLTLKQKFVACFTSVGIIISLSVFTAEMIINLLPEDFLTKLLR